MTTADRIRNRRMELGLTQLEVAKRLGLTSKAAICKVEKQGNDVTLKNVEKFAKALNCSIAYLMGWDEEEKASAEDERLEKFKNCYMQLNDPEKALIDNMITTLLSKQ